jgi:hypothetical protein
MPEQPAPQNSPKPETPPTSSTAPMKSAKAAQTSSFNQILAKVQPIAQQAWVSSRPTIAQGLKATIGLLQSATDQLDRQIQADKRPVKPLNLEPIKQAAHTFWTKTQPIWAKLIGLIRSRLPKDISGKLTDRALSGVIAGLALLLLALTTHLPSGNAAPKPQPIVAAKPLPRTAPMRPIAPSQDPVAQRFPVDAQGSQPFPTALSAPGTQPAAPPTRRTPASPIVPTQPTISIAPANPIVPTPTERKGEPPLAPTTSTVPPTTSTVPPTTSTVPPTASIQPTPPAVKLPPVKLTPDQKLLAKLQAVTGVGEASRNGNRPTLLQSVKPNKTQATLQITLKQDWYNLDFAQQDTVAQDLFTQAQKLRFKTLALVNGTGEVVARSPVVGNEMVVLLRKIEN